MNGLNQLTGCSSYKFRKNHTTQSHGPLTVLSEDEQFFKETGLMIFFFIITFDNKYLLDT